MRTWLRDQSLSLFFLGIFVVAVAGQSIAGHAVYNQEHGQSVNGWREFTSEQVEHDETPITWARYLTYPDFWEKTLQNWQSEFPKQDAHTRRLA